eukprot:6183694-Pleurochrysis_carterae.AAC.1
MPKTHDSTSVDKGILKSTAAIALILAPLQFFSAFSCHPKLHPSWKESERARRESESERASVYGYIKFTCRRLYDALSHRIVHSLAQTHKHAILLSSPASCRWRDGDGSARAHAQLVCDWVEPTASAHARASGTRVQPVLHGRRAVLWRRRCDEWQ